MSTSKRFSNAWNQGHADGLKNTSRLLDYDLHSVEFQGYQKGFYAGQTESEYQLEALS